MSEKTGGGEVSRAEEAQNLAKEAVDAIKQGDKEEGEFLADAAKELDGAAADKILKESGKQKGKG